MNEVVDAFLHLLYDTEKCLRYSPDHRRTVALVDFLKDFRLKRLNPIHRRLQRMNSGRYVLSMVGLTNVGKSTLAEALLEHPVAPRRNGPATSIPVEYEHGTGWLMKTCFSATRTVETQHFESPQSLAQMLEHRIFDVSEAQAGTIERVLVRGPMELLEGGLVFADTPGYGAAQPGVVPGSHQARLTDYVHKYVHEVLFCVSGANCAVKKEEVEFFHSIQELCSTVVVTKWESDPDTREQEMQDYKSRFAHLFPLCRFMFTEAKWAIGGQINESGADELRCEIRQRDSKDGRLSSLRQQILDAWEDLLELARDPLRESCLPAIPWREDALVRIQSAAVQSRIPFRNLL
jgi:GTP-binding protein EngB required for normal cell division